MKNISTFIIILSVVLAAFSCTKEIEDSAENPFGHSPSDTTNADSISAASIEGLHRNIFSLRCANPTCHDGSFEPDFRTVQSTFQTLVYQEVVKNDSLGSFTYRVIPGNAEQSWIIERLTTDDPFLGQMPLYSVPLSTQDIDDIKTWINSGAANINGDLPIYPNKNPEVLYYAAYDLNGNRIDTNRSNGWASPFLTPTNEDIELLFKVVDDSTASSGLLINQVLLSTSREDFSNAQLFNASYYNNEFWTATIPSSTLTPNQQFYFRYQVKDLDHIDITEYPSSDHPFYYKENASFIVQ